MTYWDTSALVMALHDETIRDRLNGDDFSGLERGFAVEAP
jgi:hypothetical protein